MEGIKKLNSEIYALEQDLADVDKEIDRLNERRFDLTDNRLAEIEGELAAALAGREEAVSRYSRAEISDDQLVAAQEKPGKLQAKKEGVAAAIEHIKNDLRDAGKKKDEIAKNIKRRKETLWTLIEEAELAKALPILRRAYAARTQRGWGRHDSVDFRSDIPLTFGLNEGLAVVASELAREYSG